MQSSTFKAWLNGSNDMEVECGRENGEPFIVTGENAHWIPLNIIVFANSPEDAIELVREAFKRCITVDYKTRTPISGLTTPAQKYEQIKQLKWTVEPYNKRFASNVQWASNSGVIT